MPITFKQLKAVIKGKIWREFDEDNAYYQKLEAKVPDYDLPDLLRMMDGRKVETAEMWRKERRLEIMDLFKEHVYGKSPIMEKKANFSIISENPNALDGLATRKVVEIQLTPDEDGPVANLLEYIPNNHIDRGIPAPAFVGLNFVGNHATTDDPEVKIHDKWFPPGMTKHKHGERSRGYKKSRWPYKFLIKEGYALATIYCGDMALDKKDCIENGESIHRYFYEDGQTSPGADEWGVIGAWAWGLSRAMDYFEQDSQIDGKKVGVWGHSRLGKTSLWAGAQDERFAIVISNDSGCGGAALSRRHFGETIDLINDAFPHWFCDNFQKYNENEDALPVDQHLLIALIAPRPVYVASAQSDLWADPKGEFLSVKHAHPVYKLLGTEGFPGGGMPGINEPVMGRMGYHIRKGRHNVTLFDWKQYAAFAKKHYNS